MFESVKEVKGGSIEEKVREIYGSLLNPRKPIRSISEAIKVLRKEFKLVVDPQLVALVYSSFMSGKPVLFEGPPGTGKTEVGYALLTLWAGKNAFILPCSENYDEYRVIGDFHPLMALKYGFVDESFIPRPLLAAMILDTGVLVDEIRRSSEEFQNLLLDIIDKRRIVVPELKRVFKANSEGFQIIFTSNPEDIAQGELSDAFLRRVVRIKFTYPPKSIEREIVTLRLEKDSKMMPRKLLDVMLDVATTLRDIVTHKPGPSDLVSWAQMSVSLAKLRGKNVVTEREVVDAALQTLCKREEDYEVIERVVKDYIGELKV